MPRRREKGDEMVSQRELVLASIMRDNQKDVTPIRRAVADDYEPWLAEKIRSGEVAIPDEFVIDDPRPAA